MKLFCILTAVLCTVVGLLGWLLRPGELAGLQYPAAVTILASLGVGCCEFLEDLHAED